MQLAPALRLSSLAQKGLAVVLGSAILTASSYAEVPMLPVPMTLQTLAVGLIGAVYGWQLGAITVLAWLGEAFFGLPVLAGDHLGGITAFAGQTGGYLMAFPFAAALTGLLAARSKGLGLSFVSMLLAHALCLIGGAAWLALLIGPEKAFAFGVTPFVLGSLVKSALGAALIKALPR
jgi:Uncharacterized conserved protein